MYHKAKQAADQRADHRAGLAHLVEEAAGADRRVGEQIVEQYRPDSPAEAAVHRAVDDAQNQTGRNAPGGAAAQRQQQNRDHRQGDGAALQPGKFQLGEVEYECKSDKNRRFADAEQVFARCCVHDFTRSFLLDT